jgi:hypothetical protein
VDNKTAAPALRAGAAAGTVGRGVADGAAYFIAFWTNSGFTDLL